MKNYPMSRIDNLVIQELNNEILIYDLNNNKVFCLNETSSLVWQLCDGSKSIAEISRLLSDKLKSTVGEELVWFALKQLKKENLIKNQVVSPIEFEGLGRREVVRKIGLGTLVAMPFILSLAAPQAAVAGGSVCDSVTDMTCLCLLSTAMNNGDSCGNGDGGNTCNPGCTCTRNTSSGSCSPIAPIVPTTVCPAVCA